MTVNEADKMNSLEFINPTELSKLDTVQLMEFINIQRELKERVTRNPLKYFWPHQLHCDGYNCSSAVIEYETYDRKKHVIMGCPQYEFLMSKKTTKSFFGSNRSGKTTSCGYEVACHTTGQYPSWWGGKQWDRPTKGRIFAEGFTKGVAVITEKLKQLLPKGLYETGKNSLGAEINWRVKHKR